MSAILDRRTAILVNQNLLTNNVSAPQRIISCAGFSITLKAVSGTVNGTFKLQATDFGDNPDLITAGDWVDIPSSSITVPATALPIGWNVMNPNHSWVRIIFTNSASTAPVVSATMTIRSRV